MSRVSGNFRQKNLLCALVPKSQLRPACAEKIAKNLVVMLRCAAFLDDVPFPGNFRVEMRIWIFPPPNLVALPIAPKHQVRVTVAIHVEYRAARLDSQNICLD